MAEFDPDKYLAEKTKTAFDPDKYLAEKTGQSVAQDMPPAPRLTPGDYAPGEFDKEAVPSAKAFAAGAGAGATGNYLTKIRAALGALPAALDPNQKYGELYDQLRKRYSDESEQMKLTNPKSYMAGTFAGAAATAPFLPEFKLAEGAGALARAAAAGAEGGIIGGLSNPGETFGEQNQKDPLQVGSRAGNALIGAGLGAGISSAVSGAQELPETLQNLRQKLALRQLGANKAQTAMLKKTGMLPKAEEFMYQNGMLSPGSTLETVVDTSGKIKNTTGARIGAIHNSINEDAVRMASEGALTPEQQALLDQATLNPESLTGNINAAIKKNYSGLSDGRQAITKVEGDLSNLHDLPLQNGEPEYSKVYDYQKSLQKNINYNRNFADSATTEQAEREARDLVKQALRNRAQAVTKVAGDEGRVAELNTLEPTYHVSKTVSDIAEKQQAGEEAKSMIGLLPTIGGAAVGAAKRSLGGTAVEAAGEALLTALGIKLARKYGPGVGYSLTRNIGSPIADALSPVATQLPNNVGRTLVSPWVSLSQQNKEK